MPRSSRALRPVENRPTAYGARACWRAWRGCLRGKRGARYTPRRLPRLLFTDTATSQQLRLRSVVTIAFESHAARPARATPYGNLGVRPWSTLALEELTLLSLRPSRRALHLTPLAEALLLRHRARFSAAAFTFRDNSLRITCRADRARFAPWRTSRPRMKHARAGGLGVVVSAGNAERAPSHAVGRGSYSSTLRQGFGCGIGPSCQ